MTPLLRVLIRFALLLLLVSLFFGLLASLSFLYPESFNKFLPFYQLRPFHVSSAVFWIISGAASGILFYKKEVLHLHASKKIFEALFITLWIGTILCIFGCYAFKIFGGREYWEFPAVLSIPLLLAWLLFMVSYFFPVKQPVRPIPQYLWMWSTGILFFLLTFIEQNLWNIPWFRESFLKEITVQWKANGAMVGAWNQMIYGTAMFIMVKISGDESLAHNKKSYVFYFIGFANLMFNWGHHIYNVPGAGWIRDVSYIISMTEWFVFISIIRDFKNKLEESRRLKHLFSYRFILASEFWVFLNLFLALMMSIPAINRYTHGTHITVAHAMGTTIGINTMILLGSLGYIIKIDEQSEQIKKYIRIGFWVGQISLGIFWFTLIGAGITKGYRSVGLNITNFQEMMAPVLNILKVSSIAGLGLLLGLGCVVICYLITLKKYKTSDVES